VYTFGELFAGIGGISLGFKQVGFIPIWSNDIDEKTCVTYKNNFPVGVNVINKDIKCLDCSTLSAVNVLLAGFPCQAFSIAGNRMGFRDVRGNVFFDLFRFIRFLMPEVVFLENVKNLLSHDKGKTFSVICDLFKGIGYFIRYKVMNTFEYSNLPQNRERIYIVCFKNKQAYFNFDFPDKVVNTKPVSSFLEKNVSEGFYYYRSKYYDKLKQEILAPGFVYQWRRVYLRKNVKGLCPTLTANMGMGGHNVPLIHDGIGIRKFTPRECARLQGFPDSFVFPSVFSNSVLYKQIGNSVSVPVIVAIASKILESL
jgi:DNA (cytosine-5)-methyltransferase 1